MAEAIGNSSLIESLNQGAQSNSAKAKTKSNELGQDAFLKLLITQLKNQDPLDPMKNDQFAVDMANFSQVEQLIGIKEQLTKSSGGDLGSLATYLGREVVTDSENVSISAGDGGRIKLNLAADAASVKVEILDSEGAVKETFDAGELAKGEHTLKLENLTSPEGEYKYKVKAVSSSGGEVTSKAEVAGIVSGFIPGADPKLLIGNQMITPANIKRVGLA